MYEVKLKLSAMHLGGRKTVLYKAILKLVLQETYVMCECICTFLAKYAAFRILYPEKSLPYS